MPSGVSVSNPESRHFSRNPKWIHPISGAKNWRRILPAAARVRPASARVRLCAAHPGFHNDFTPVRLPYVLSPPVLPHGLRQNIRPSGYAGVVAHHSSASATSLPVLLQGLDIEVDFSLPAERVIRSLEHIIAWRGKPGALRCDNGPEYISGALLAWAQMSGIRIQHIQPGKPQQNAYVERYNRTVRYDWLAQTLFDSIDEVQASATRWLWTYNHERPNMALGGITPMQKLALAA